MKQLIKYIASAIGFILLCKISPLGAVVAVLCAIIKCSFKGRAIGHFVGALMHSAVLGIWHRIFGPPKVRIVVERQHQRMR